MTGAGRRNRWGENQEDNRAGQGTGVGSDSQNKGRDIGREDEGEVGGTEMTSRVKSKALWGQRPDSGLRS